MSLNVLRRAWRANSCATIALIVTSCGGESVGQKTSYAVTVVDGIPGVVATPPPPPPPPPTSTPVPVAPLEGATTGVIVQAGDSIGVGLGADDWAAINHLGFVDTVRIHNVSVSGIAMQAGYGQRVADLFIFYSSKSPSILLIQQGTNDLYYGTKASTLYRSILSPFVSSARAAGFYVVVDSILPRSDSGWTAAMEQQRVSYNALVRSNGAYADAINDIAADPLIGDSINPTTSTYYADALHLTLSGQQRLATLNAAVLGPLLQRSVRPPQR